MVTVLMTAPTMDAAETVVGSLLDERLIACGSMIPGVESLYRWKGAVHRDEEVVVIIKTVRRLVPRVLERARALHPYDVPELLVQEVADGNPAYLDWVEEECG